MQSKTHSTNKLNACYISKWEWSKQSKKYLAWSLFFFKCAFVCIWCCYLRFFKTLCYKTFCIINKIVYIISNSKYQLFTISIVITSQIWRQALNTYMNLIKNAVSTCICTSLRFDLCPIKIKLYNKNTAMYL